MMVGLNVFLRLLESFGLLNSGIGRVSFSKATVDETGDFLCSDYLLSMSTTDFTVILKHKLGLDTF